MLLSLFLLLPGFAYGNIRVYIKASTLETGAHIEYLGANVDVVTDTDISTFNLEGNSLAKAVRSEFGDIPPNTQINCFVKNDEHTDLHKINHWNEVTRRIIPVTGRVIDFNIETIDVMRKEVYNNNDVAENHRIELNNDLVYTVYGYWINGGFISLGDDILHEIDFGIDGVDSIVKHKFYVPLGVNINQEKSIKITETVEVTIDPDRMVEAVLKLNKVTMDLEVNYNISLGGDVACEYPEVFGKARWAFDVNKVLEAAEKPTTIEWSEVLRLVYYTSPEVIVVSKADEEIK